MSFQYINLKYLQDFTQGDVEQMRRIINIFIKNAPDLLDQMKNGYEQKDFNQIKTSVHTLKSQVTYMGLNEIRPTILEVEEMVDAKQHSELMKEKINSIYSYIQSGMEELQQI